MALAINITDGRGLSNKARLELLLKKSKVMLYGPYPQLRHKIKMAAIVGGLCTGSLWRGYRFAMNDIKKFKNISGEAYIQSSNANAYVLLNLSIFWLVFIIPGELILYICLT